MDVDLWIRNGLIVDGNGGKPFVGDIAVRGDSIVAVGPRLDVASARDTIDATGRHVMPGWTDVHTHYDTQVRERRHDAVHCAVHGLLSNVPFIVAHVPGCVRGCVHLDHRSH